MVKASQCFLRVHLCVFFSPFRPPLPLDRHGGATFPWLHVRFFVPKVKFLFSSFVLRFAGGFLPSSLICHVECRVVVWLRSFPLRNDDQERFPHYKNLSCLRIFGVLVFNLFASEHMRRSGLHPPVAVPPKRRPEPATPLDWCSFTAVCHCARASAPLFF